MSQNLIDQGKSSWDALTRSPERRKGKGLALQSCTFADLILEINETRDIQKHHLPINTLLCHANRFYGWHIGDIFEAYFSKSWMYVISIADSCLSAIDKTSHSALNCIIVNSANFSKIMLVALNKMLFLCYWCFLWQYQLSTLESISGDFSPSYYSGELSWW